VSRMDRVIPGPFRSSLDVLEGGGALSTEQDEAAMASVMDGFVPNEALARWLGAFALRVPEAHELVGFVKAFQARMVRIPTAVPPERILDTCGTGGAPKVFNASTLAGLVATAGGAPCAKHGNRSRTGFGSAETIAALGISIESTPERQAADLEKVGFCFCMAPRHHPGAAHAAPVRKVLGGPTIFNVIGPLTNPAGALRQVLGVWDERLMQPVAQTLAAMGASHAMVLHSRDGLDEASICAPTRYVLVDRGSVVETSEFDPGMFGLTVRATPPEPARNLADAVSIATSLLEGRDMGARRDMLVMNAAIALVVSGHRLSWRDAAGHARDLLDSRRVLHVVERGIESSRG
jgi:anthranilate phosphoribosyltransferase